MIKTITHIHELWENDDVIEVLPRIYKGDVGSAEITVEFTKDGEPVDLSEYAVSLTNCAPNKAKVVLIGGPVKPLQVDGNRVTWTLQAFDTKQTGTYLAQLHVATSDQLITVVFIRYNVERGVDGNFVTEPVQYTGFSELIKMVEDLRKEVSDILSTTDELLEIYDLFKQIVEDGGVTWDTMLGKPDVFPPAAHTHAEFTEIQNDLDEFKDKTETSITNLEQGKAAKSRVIRAEFPTSGWSTGSAPFIQTVSNPEFTASLHALPDIVHSDDPATETELLTAWGRVNFFKQAEGSVTAVCVKEIPQKDLTVDFLVIG